MKKNESSVCIIGAGPSGLGCAHELQKNQYKGKVVLLEKNSAVGGLARTYNFRNHHFDIGPHRFFTKNHEVLSLWRNILKKELITVNRLTRILYKNKLFLYPVRLMDVIKKLGLFESFSCLVSYTKAKILLSKTHPKTFDTWITKHFGKKLYSIFFKTYTEKVWGIPCSKIGAEWASQRIKNLNFYEVVKTAIFGERVRKAKSLIDFFYYPKKGAGYFYEKLAHTVRKKGANILLNYNVTTINHRNKHIIAVDTIPVSYLFSSMPLTHFIESLHPLPPRSILTVARKLYYRDHITVNFIVDNRNLFPDNWIYVHSPEVKMARVTNYNNFMKHKTSNMKQSAISVEYFVFKNDRIWNLSDKQLLALAKKELAIVELVKPQDIIDGFVVRETESYPTYYLGHKKYFELLKNYVSQFKNLQLIGRGGMYKYNNMDHAIYSGMLASRNFLAGKNKYDVWKINEDAEYLEYDKIKP